jgi:hypothetical protein
MHDEQAKGEVKVKMNEQVEVKAEVEVRAGS